ncbi:heme peroxidase [Gorgonomyces haynaldii]|nr:heme peroxidase [Gorgonomyces haynaldii]
MTVGNDSDTMQLTVSNCDLVVDYLPCAGTTTFNITRAQFNYTQSSGRSIINYATSYLDASTVYGHSVSVAASLRTFSNGLLKTYVHPTTGQEFPPLVYNFTGEFGVMQNVSNTNALFECGDQRANSNPALQAIHTLFLREHNRRARELKRYYPDWTDETLYQRARVWVIALVQKITYTEYLPVILGASLSAYAGYTESVDPSIDLLFSGAAMRYGHTAASPLIFRVDEKGNKISQGHLSLKEHYFSTRAILATGEIDSILRGLTKQKNQEIDTLMSEETRKRLFDTPFDLASLNILRGRDLGLPSYSDARAAMNLSRPTRYSDITSDATIAGLLQSLYPNISDIDVWVGGLAEGRGRTSQLGGLFTEIVRRQFTNIRNSDRFWYERTGVLTTDEKGNLTSWNMKKVIQSNTMIASYPTWPMLYFAGVFTSLADTSQQQFATLNVDSAMRIVWTSTDYKNFSFLLCSNTQGWLGIGFNDRPLMDGAELLIATKTVNWTVNIYLASVHKPSLANLTGVSNVRDASSVCGTAQGVGFDLDNTSAGPDTFFPSNRSITVLYARADPLTLSYHGALTRGARTVNIVAALNQGGIIQSDDHDINFEIETKLVTVHGICMFVTYGFLYPTGIFLIRYLGGISSSVVHYHAEFMYYGSLLSEFATLLLLFGITPKYSRPHPIMGLTVSALMFVTPIFGSLAKGNYKFAFKYFKYFRWTHKSLGYFTLLLGYATSGMGVNDISGYNLSLFGMSLVYAFIAWAVTWLLIFVVLGEMGYMRMYLLSMQLKQKKKSVGRRDSLVMATKVLTFSWDEILDKIDRGSDLVVIKGNVYDVDTFIAGHPGGAALLASTLGTDATRAYFGSLSLEQDSKKKKDMMKEDVKNNIHHHSTLANKMLQDMSIGSLLNVDEQQEELNDYIDDKLGKKMERRRSSVNPDDMHGKMRAKFGHKVLSESEQELASQPHAIKPEYYSRMFLVEKRCLTKDSQYPVYAFKFRFEREKCQVLLVPGDSIELMFLLEPLPDGKPRQHRFVVRSYTLTQVFSQSTIEIYVKMMPDGQMSKHLSQLKVGQSIRCRGPHQHSLCLYLGSDFGVYQKLILICAGSGLTPMLLLIDYYLRCKAKGANVTEIILIQSFRDQGDLFLQDRVGEYVKKSDGILKVHTTLTGDCGKDWKGMTGRVTEKMLSTILKRANVMEVLTAIEASDLDIAGSRQSGIAEEETAVTADPPKLPALEEDAVRTSTHEEEAPRMSTRRRGSDAMRMDMEMLKQWQDPKLGSRKNISKQMPTGRRASLSASITREQFSQVTRRASISAGFNPQFGSGGALPNVGSRQLSAEFGEIEQVEFPEFIFLCGPTTFNDAIQDILLDKLNFKFDQVMQFWGGEPTKPDKSG